MPPVDVVAISHDHYDHLDYPTIRALAKTGVPFVASLGVGAHLEYWGVQPERITELDWWESHTLPNTDVVLTAAPSQHFSGRGLKDRNATLWSSLAIRSPRHAVFFSGDTGLTTEYRSIRERLGPFDLVMLEIGAFYPAWGDIHLGPDNALMAHAMLGGVFMPVHWGTFCIGHACLGSTGREIAGARAPHRRAVAHAVTRPTGRSQPMLSSSNPGGVRSTAAQSSLHPVRRGRVQPRCPRRYPGRWISGIDNLVQTTQFIRITA